MLGARKELEQSFDETMPKDHALELGPVDIVFF